MFPCRVQKGGKKKEQKKQKKNTLGHKNGDMEILGTHSVSVAYSLQPDPPPWTLPEQGISAPTGCQKTYHLHLRVKI